MALAVALAAASAPSASAAGTPVAGVQWTLAVDRHLRTRLDERCVAAPRAAWRDDATRAVGSGRGGRGR